ncbi:MAG: 23S rRNA (adenine(2503)-C(2))-methyltransferase RlmN [Bacteroidales bacterium]|nr:23S rRNA (adenine(2503)-C(2))-methyltransferase RlmN [Bacteroidales bacterium]
MIQKQVLLGMTIGEIQESTKAYGFKNYIPREIALWIYRRGAKSFDEMTNISKKNREILNENFELGLSPPVKETLSSDGSKKYLFSVPYEKYIEAAYIPEGKRHTLCISSQIGCKLGCLFCMTGKQGFQGQLSSNEILNQVISLPEREKITNLVYMGMGEPFDNTDQVLKTLDILTADYGLAVSPRKITVSTVGLIPGMKKFIGESRCQLAVSLHSPFDNERSMLMPAQKAYSIQNIIKLLKEHDFEKRRRISFEYILFKGLNDSDRHVKELTRLLNGLRCRINLIRFHMIPGTPLKGTSEKEVQDFRDKLDSKGITATVRKSRGEDIMAACGLLSTSELLKNKQSAE